MNYMILLLLIHLILLTHYYKDHNFDYIPPFPAFFNVDAFAKFKFGFILPVPFTLAVCFVLP